jgi:hypothetical protein
VIFPVRTDNTVDDKEDSENGFPDMEVFSGHVPVPMVVPGREYAGRKPWFFKEA